MFLRYIGNDEILSIVCGNTPHKFAISTLNRMFLLTIITLKHGPLTLSYNSLSDILKVWEEVKETEVNDL